MTPIATMLANALLAHHREACLPHAARPPIINQCLITYGDLCRAAGTPGIEIGIGKYLFEVAEWCTSRHCPPINSLAVNAQTRMPGESYELAPGCSLLTWPAEVETTITYRDYPQSAP